MYKDINYNNGIAPYGGNDANYTNNFFEQTPQLVGLNDNTSSIVNRGQNCNTNHYKNINYGGTTISTLRGWNYPTITLNDQLSSHKWIC